MPDLQAADIADLMTTTLRELGKLKFTDLMSNYQNTIALQRIMRKGKMTFNSGTELQFNIITGHNNSARFVGLYAHDVIDVPNVMTIGQIPWRHVTWNWALDRRVIAMNRTPSKIVDMTKVQRIASFGAAIELFERSIWRVPATDDNTSIYGIPYYIVKSATAATKANNNGFNGTVPSGYSVVANLSPTTYERWRNYADAYTNVSKDDLIKKVRRAMYYTNFKPLVAGMPTYATGMDRAMYTNYEVLGQLEQLLENQNENLGNDLASKDGKAVIRRVDVEGVIELDEDTTNPVYGIDWSEMGAMGLRGEWMNETVEPKVSGQHTVAATFTDCSCNLYCRNRRKQFVISNGTSMPA